MENKKIRVAITHGDTNGIGYELIFKTFSDPAMLELCTPIIYGSPKVAAYHRNALGIQANFTIINSAEDAQNGRLNLLTTFEEEVKVELGSPSKEAGVASLKALDKAMEDYSNGLFDVLVGVNLLREGLDIPTVSLVAILDADKEGFLRSGRSLTQTAGRAARNVNGLVIMYADSITGSMQETIYETDRRRSKQMEYNKLHNITPTQVAVKKNVLTEEYPQNGNETAKRRNPRLANTVSGRVSAANSYEAPHYIPDPSDLGKGTVSVGLGHDSKREGNSAYKDGYIEADLAAVLQDPVIRSMSRIQVEKAAEQAKRNMQKAASDLDFMAAAKYRDEMWALQAYLKVWKDM